MPTVFVYREFLSPQDVELFQQVAEEALGTKPKRMVSRSRVRRWGFWGWHFKRPWPKPADMGEMPEWVRDLRDRAEVLSSCKGYDSATLSEFLPNAGLSPHVDSPVFDDAIAAVSVGPGTLRLFSANPDEYRNEPGSDPGSVTDEVEIPSGSLYLMTRPVVHSVVAGRQTRLSLTFRRVRV